MFVQFSSFSATSPRSPPYTSWSSSSSLNENSNSIITSNNNKTKSSKNKSSSNDINESSETINDIQTYAFILAAFVADVLSNNIESDHSKIDSPSQYRATTFVAIVVFHIWSRHSLLQTGLFASTMSIVCYVRKNTITYDSIMVDSIFCFIAVILIYRLSNGVDPFSKIK